MTNKLECGLLIHMCRYIPRTVQLNIPAPLSQLYKPQYRTLSEKELQAKSEEVFTGLSLTEEQVVQPTFRPTSVISKCMNVECISVRNISGRSENRLCAELKIENRLSLTCFSPHES